jgi:hypothetical protein
MIEKAHRAYYDQRFKRPYRWFRAPVDIHFVEFAATVHQSHPTKLMVNSLIHPMALPRKSQKGVKDRYDFLDPIPGGVPIPAQTFLNFLTLPRSKIKDEIKSGQKIWLPRLAKRRYISVRSARGLEANIFEQEWGVRVIEGPSYLFFISIAVLFGISSLLVGCIVAWKLGDPYKGLGGAATAFAIGSYTLKLVYDLMKDMDTKAKSS